MLACWSYSPAQYDGLTDNKVGPSDLRAVDTKLADGKLMNSSLICRGLTAVK